MQELMAKIKTVSTDRAEISFTKPDVERVDIAQESKAKIRIPKNAADNSLMLQITTELSCGEGVDLKVCIQNTYEFELSGTPDDYLSYGKEVCLPIAQAAQNETIENIVKNFGIEPQKE